MFFFFILFKLQIVKSFLCVANKHWTLNSNVTKGAEKVIKFFNKKKGKEKEKLVLLSVKAVFGNQRASERSIEK